jgi:hypothetical protein
MYFGENPPNFTFARKLATRGAKSLQLSILLFFSTFDKRKDGCRTGPPTTTVTTVTDTVVTDTAVIDTVVISFVYFPTS